MKKFLKYLVAMLLVVIILGLVFLYYQVKPTTNPGYGITFSPTHAQYLGFDWKQMYLDILNDLQPKKIRLMTYWEIMEREPDLWYFQDVDEMLDEADKRGIEVILVVGHKQPRWPECHHPAWYKDLSTAEKNEALLRMVEVAVNHYKRHESIKWWQVENEALFGFGPECDKVDKEILRQEVELVRSLDDRPIIMTDSGELGRWVPTAKFQPDVFGSTMYRLVHHEKYGYFEYPLPPAFFRIKAGLTKVFTGTERFKGVELQAEPWFSEDITRTSMETQLALMNPTILRDNVEYATRAGFEDHYFWGVEWWYWLAKEKNDWGMWNEGKQYLNQ